MSRERPMPAPRVLPDAKRGVKHESARQRRAREEVERLKQFSGPGFMGGLMATFGAGPLSKGPVFIRRGYEAGIVDELNDFYARRPRPWRPAANAPKPNRKTLPRRLGLKAMQRRQDRNAAYWAIKREGARRHIEIYGGAAGGDMAKP